jgi:hypothetical protein
MTRTEWQKILKRLGVAPQRKRRAADIIGDLHADCLARAVALSDKLSRLHDRLPEGGKRKALVRNALYRVYKVIFLLRDLPEEDVAAGPLGRDD